MREAFDSRDVSKLQEVALTMDKEIFSHHLKRCIDSGLWLPDGGNKQEGEEEEEEREGEKETVESKKDR